MYGPDPIGLAANPSWPTCCTYFIGRMPAAGSVSAAMNCPSTDFMSKRMVEGSTMTTAWMRLNSKFQSTPSLGSISCSKENFTSSAVTGSPFENLCWARWKV